MKKRIEAWFLSDFICEKIFDILQKWNMCSKNLSWILGVSLNE